jgi:N-formylglutamate amidohydrolase
MEPRLHPSADVQARSNLAPPLFDRVLGDLDSPLLAVALHHGDAVRGEVAALLALDADRRLAEEDPLTGVWAEIAQNRLVALRSRFEVDLNRSPETAVYVTPEHAWGLELWRSPPPPELVERSQAEHARFYRSAHEMLSALLARNERVLVLDLHSYNHRRGGPHAPPADPAQNPELNVGTGSLDRERWGHVVDRFIDAARDGGAVDVRENVRFRGRYFAGWAHRTFPEQVCVLALEVKKTFMDEHDGCVDLRALLGWRERLRVAASAALGALEGGA